MVSRVVAFANAVLAFDFASAAAVAAEVAAVNAEFAVLAAAVTLSFVCFNCLPVTASVLAAVSAASVNPVIL
ncbi:hypothetical protein [Haemophilus aegyptius]|uniref:hypothetical protein n=1 Tax=Haemophilus aegyptius TaxID=197575 RepID=UPI0012B5CE69|nr:hypothetical protein [Haemophilus aegyptius]UAK82243.1 hypothetical protein K8O83_08140 [Haemophilus aegyptius]